MMAVSAPVEVEPDRKPPVQRWWERSRRRTPSVIAGLTWLIGLLTVISALMRHRHHRWDYVASLLSAPVARQTTATATAVAATLGVLLCYPGRRAAPAQAPGLADRGGGDRGGRARAPGQGPGRRGVGRLAGRARRCWSAPGGSSGPRATRPAAGSRSAGSSSWSRSAPGSAWCCCRRTATAVLGQPSLAPQLRHVLLGLVGVTGPVRFAGDGGRPGRRRCCSGSGC